MPDVEFFQRRGFFAVRRFLSPSLCDRIRREMAAGSARYASVATIRVYRDLRRRKVLQARVPERTRRLVAAKVRKLLPRLERHYRAGMTGHEELGFLRYRKGHFQEPHKDFWAPGMSKVMPHRKVSVVIFLNGPADAPRKGGYTGGDLMIYGLFRKGAWADCGLPLQAEKGLLFTFPSTRRHAVAPVTSGERNTIVTWCYARAPGGS